MTTTTAPQSRDLPIEFLRVICCFAVIMIHVSPEYALDGKYNDTALILQSIVRAGLPIFIIISGYFLLNQPVTSLGKFYATRLPGVIIPFLIYGYIHFFMVHNMGNLPGSWRAFFHTRKIIDFFELVMAGPSVNYKGFISQHFWFVYWITGLYLITPALKILLDAIKPEHSAMAIVILVAMQAYNLYMPQPFIFLPSLNIWLLYYVLGGLLRRLDDQRFRLGAWVAIPLMYIATAWITRVNAAHGWPMNQYVDGINMVVLTCAILYTFRGVTVNDRWRPILTFLSARSYGIYLSHIFIYYYFNDTIKALFENSMVWALATGIFVFAMATVLTTVVDALIVNPLVSKAKQIPWGRSKSAASM